MEWCARCCALRAFALSRKRKLLPRGFCATRFRGSASCFREYFALRAKGFSQSPLAPAGAPGRRLCATRFRGDASCLREDFRFAKRFFHNRLSHLRVLPGGDCDRNQRLRRWFRSGVHAAGTDFMPRGGVRDRLWAATSSGAPRHLPLKGKAFWGDECGGCLMLLMLGECEAFS